MTLRSVEVLFRACKTNAQQRFCCNEGRDADKLIAQERADDERAEAEAAWLEEHPPGSACSSACGHCGRCT